MTTAKAANPRSDVSGLISCISRTHKELSANIPRAERYRPVGYTACAVQHAGSCGPAHHERGLRRGGGPIVAVSLPPATSTIVSARTGAAAASARKRTMLPGIVPASFGCFRRFCTLPRETPQAIAGAETDNRTSWRSRRITARSMPSKQRAIQIARRSCHSANAGTKCPFCPFRLPGAPVTLVCLNA